MLAPVQVLLKKARPHLEARTPDTGHRTLAATPSARPKKAVEQDGIFKGWAAG
jgi:hypothetical protein